MTKKIFLPLLAAALTLGTLNASAAKAELLKEKVAAMSLEEKKERLEEIKDRVEEIKDLDKADMTVEEKQNMKNELKDLKKEYKETSRGLYLSFGAIIIIILLLILIL